MYLSDHLKKQIDDGVVVVGRHSYGTPCVKYWTNQCKLIIGSFCSIAEGVVFLLDGEHRPDWLSTYPFNAPEMNWPANASIKGHPWGRGDITIGSDVWIGTDALILSGVTIGHGAVIGARSVVSRDVPPYAIVAGNPAQVRRQRFAPDIIQALLDLAWWDLSDEIVQDLAPLLQSDSIEQALIAIRAARTELAA